MRAIVKSIIFDIYYSISKIKCALHEDQVDNILLEGRSLVPYFLHPISFPFRSMSHKIKVGARESAKIEMALRFPTTVKLTRVYTEHNKQGVYKVFRLFKKLIDITTEVGNL